MNLSFPQEGVLVGDRLFDLEDHGRAAEDFLMRLDQTRAGRFIFLVRKAAARPGVALDHHDVTARNELRDT